MSVFGLDGRTVLVTGAGRGLGRAIALAAAGAGASVVAVSRSADQLAEVAGAAAGLRGGVLPLPWDLSDVDALDELVAALPTEAVHGVVHAAGTQLRRASSEVTAAEWQAVLTLNLTVPFLLSTAVFRTRPAPASHVFVGSLTSSIGVAGLAPYGAAKSGLMGVVRTLAVEWARQGVRVNALNPGYFRTELTEAVFSDPARGDWVLSRIPMGRTGEPDEVGDAAVFLLSEASRYVTGQVINVDGGWLAA